MNETHEVVQIKLEDQASTKRGIPTKIAVRIKSDPYDIFVYNGANLYLVQTILKEVIAHDS